jgi:hypothetical protein
MNTSKVLTGKPIFTELVVNKSKYWIIEYADKDCITIDYFESLEEMQQHIEDQTINYGENGNLYKTIAQSHTDEYMQLQTNKKGDLQ